MFGVKSWLILIRIFSVIFALCLFLVQQLEGQIRREGIKRDTTNLIETIDTLDDANTDSVEVFQLSYKEKYNSIKFTKSLAHFNYQNVDTLFELEHQFDPANKKKYRYNNIGVIGTPVYDLLPEYSSLLNFDLGFNQFKPYQINADSIEIYKINAPYTKLSWRFGTKKQQFFNILHANRIKNALQLGVRLNRMSTEGFYPNQTMRHSDFSAYTSYDAKNKKYKLITTVTTKKYVQQQNGGVNEESFEIFPNTAPHDRDSRIVNTYLQDSFGRNDGLNIALNQFYNIGKYFDETTTDSTTVKRFVPQFRLKHKIAFVRDNHIFNGNASSGYSFYPDSLLNQENFYIDTVKTNKWVNQLALIQTGKKASSSSILNLPFKSVLSLNYERINVKRLYVDTLKIFTDTLKVNNTWLQFNLSDNFEDNPLSYNITAQYGLGANNYQTNKYYFKAAAKYQLPQLHSNVGLSFQINNYNAALLYNNYNSNFYKWQNSFDAVNTNTIEANYTNTKHKLSLSASIINFKNLPYFFFQDEFNPANIKLATGSLYRFQLCKTFTIGWWKMRHQLVYQTENNADIDLPNWVYSGSFYYSDFWFKSALNFNIGFDVRYFSSFNLPYYNPVIGQFYNQNNLKGNLYPTIDFFINCKIQTAVLFFKVEYLNQNWFQRGYYTAINYPAADYTFRGGISWRLFD